MNSEKEEFNFITKDDIINILGEEPGNTFLQESNYEILPYLEKIKILCEQYNKMSDEEYDKKYLLGFNLGYKLRSFLLEEDITFVLGDIRGSEHNLVTKEIKMSEILKDYRNLKIDLNEKKIALDNGLLKKSNMEQVDNHINSIWRNVYEAQDYEWKEEPKDKKSEPHEKIGRIYQKSKKDKNVWINYKTAKNGSLRRNYYYQLGPNSYINYNRGWIFEWFQDYIQIKKHQQSLEKNLKNSDTPLYDLINTHGRERVEGIKGGDYVKNGKQYQAKFTNNKIMSFANIDTLIKDIQKIIDNYTNKNKKNKQYNSNEISRAFFDLFTFDEIKGLYKAPIKTIREKLNKMEEEVKIHTQII